MQARKVGLYHLLLQLNIIAIAASAGQQDLQESILRKQLKNTSFMVRPVKSPSDKVHVNFSANIISLIEVNIKKQSITTKLAIIQKWENPFLVWSNSTYGMDKIRMTYNEIWVPGIKLINDPDNPPTTSQPLFKSMVTVYSNGTNVWSFVEVINSECNIDVAMFPFDEQTCKLNFSSEFYESSLLKINLHKDRNTKDYKDISKGGWIMENIKSELNHKSRDHLDVQDTFDVVTITLSMKRRSFFYVLFFLFPCIVLSMLMFISFSIPPDSGERIGFCSSLLLALSVYLLLLTEILPNSNHISILGLMFVVVFLETALALLATVIVLKAFHSSNKVPLLLRFFCGLGCSNKKDKKPKKKTKIVPLKFMKAKNPSNESNITRLEDATKFSDEVRDYEDLPEEPNEENNYEENHRRWAHVAKKLDKFFFWSFMVGMFASLAAMHGYKDTFKEIDF